MFWGVSALAYLFDHQILGVMKRKLPFTPTCNGSRLTPLVWWFVLSRIVEKSLMGGLFRARPLHFGYACEARKAGQFRVQSVAAGFRG